MGEEILIENGFNDEIPVVIPAEEDIDVNELEDTKSSLKKEEKTELVNCLRNERISVKLVEKYDPRFTKGHPFYGNLADGATVTFTVPLLRNGSFVNPLTTEEKDYLEEAMGLEPNALSIHKAHENFWENRQVTIEKTGTVLDLSTPMGYIEYKILLANKDTICPSLEELKSNPKATYRFVLVSDKQIYDSAVEKASMKSKCWKEYQKIENDINSLRSVIETLTGRGTDPKSEIEFIQEAVIDLLEKDPRRFYTAVSDPLLKYKVLIKEAVAKSVVDRRGDYFYYNDEPLCGKNENPTITVAAKYISNPRNQEILFSIQGKLK